MNNNENPFVTVVALATLDAKRQTLEARIERYTAYVAHDQELCAKSEKHAKRYAARLRNHQDKLARHKENLSAVLAALAALTNATK